MGVPLHLRLHRSPLTFLELPQIRALLVRIHRLRHLPVRLAGPLRLRPLRGSVRGSLHGGGARRRGSGHRCHLDHGIGVAHLLWKAQASSGYGGQEADC